MATKDTEQKELTMAQKCLNIVRIYFSHGLIINNELPRKSMYMFHNVHKRSVYFVEPGQVISFLIQWKIIVLIGESKRKSIIKFIPEKLHIILAKKDEYILNTGSKKVVSQNLAFKPPKKTATDFSCTTCKKTFLAKKDLDQHNRAKKHVITKLKKEVKKVDTAIVNSSENSGVFAEINTGTQNGRETIFCKILCFEKVLTIHNRTAKAITLDKIENVNTPLSKCMEITYETVTIPAMNSYNVKLRLRFESERAYVMPLICTYTTAELTSEDFQGFHKVLIFEISAKNLESLQPSSPYHRQNLVVTGMAETIIPGEKPEFQTDFIPVHRLQNYCLTPEHIKIFNSGLQTMPTDETSKKLYLKFTQLLGVQEKVHCLTHNNYKDMLHLLLYLEEHQMKIDIRNYDTLTDKLTHFKANLYNLEIPELSENRPSLILGDSVFVKVPGSQTKYEGIVHEKARDTVKLAFNRKFATVYVKNMKFEVSFGFNRTTLKLEHQAAQLAANCAKYFFPEEISPSEQADLSITCFNKKINDNAQQLQAVREIVKGSASSVPYLIFGPPGTGKSVTIVEAILQIRTIYADKRILICAPSNSAANLIGERLLDFSSFSEDELLRYLSYNCNVADIDNKLRKYCNLKNGIICHPTLESLKTFKLVITTLATAGRLYNAGIPKDHFYYVFIDEAGHATESETLIPITAVLVNQNKVNGRVVLAGDPEQLGPIIHSSIAKLYGFGISMLERLMTTNSIYKKHDGAYDNRVLTKLLNNYRSHPDIIALPNQICYGDELIPKGNEFINIALGNDILPNKKFPIIFHSVLGHDNRESNSPSFFNIQEVSTVYDYLDKLIDCEMSGYKVSAKDIAVVTPYRKQVQKLRQLCGRDPKFDKLEVGSVEKLQGQERLIVIISTVRAKPEYVKHDVKFHLGFLKNKKRMNVALTRAKALLIVIGNPDLLKYDENWSKFIQHCIDNNATIGPSFSMDLEEGDDLLESIQDLRIDDDILFRTDNN